MISDLIARVALIILSGLFLVPAVYILTLLGEDKRYWPMVTKVHA